MPERHSIGIPSPRSAQLTAVGLLVVSGWIASGPAVAVEPLGPAELVVPVGDGPLSLTAADFDGNGGLDLVVANTSSDSVSVVLGDGLGGFTSTSAIGVGDAPGSIAAGDFDGDGAPDLAVANRGDDTVTVLLGDGLGGFVWESDVGVGDLPSFVAVGDFDGDTVPDLAVANENDDSIGVLLGDGAGGFVPAPDVGVGDRPRSIVVADLDGDADLDLAVANWGFADNSVSVLLGDGQGSFVRTSDIPVGRSPNSLVVGDFDGDGSLDLATANLLGDSVSILQGDGLGGFVRTLDVGVERNPDSLAVGDFDGDGAPDLAVASSTSRSVGLLVNDGLGAFSRTQDVSLAVPPKFVITGDFDGTGSSDLALVSEWSDTLAVLLGDGLGGFVRAAEISTGDDPECIASGDFNGDGVPDLVTGDWGEFVSTVSLLLGDGLGSFAHEIVTDVIQLPFSIAVADFDRDEDLDLAVVSRHRGTVGVLLGDGSGGFIGAPDVAAGWQGTRVVVTGDYDGNGVPDLAVTNRIDDVVGVFLGDGEGGFDQEALVAAGDGPHGVGQGDFDGNGVLDLAVTNEEGNTVSVLMGDGLGSFTKTQTVPVGDAPLAVGVGDFNGDGSADLAVANTGEDSLSVLLGNGSGSFTRTLDMGVTPSPSSISVGDFDGGGALDLAVVGSAAVSVLFGDGRGGFIRASDVGVGSSPIAGAVGDYNADGTSDVAVANSGSDSVSVLFNQMRERADINASNRVDGFDIGAVGRLAGAALGDPEYRRNTDVVPDGIIDGDDLARVALRFGELNREVSPLRARVTDTVPPDLDTVTIQQVEAVGDLVTLQVVVNTDRATAAADFVLTFQPSDGDPIQVLEYLSHDEGSYMSGGATTLYTAEGRTPGQVEVGVLRQPLEDHSTSNAQPLLELTLRARRAGVATFEFEPASSLLAVTGCGTVEGCPVPGVSFVGGSRAVVDASAGGPPGQKISFSPALLDLGRVAVGASTRKNLRVSNFGFSDLELRAVSATLPEFTSFFPDCGESEGPEDTCVTIPPFGTMTLPVEFSPAREGIFSADLLISSNDPQNAEVHVPLTGKSGRNVAVTPERVAFGIVPVGGEKTRRVRVRNLGTSSLVLKRLESSDLTFVPEATFDVLGPGASGEVDVHFRPGAEGEIRGTLTLALGDSTEITVVVSLAGEGASVPGGAK